MQNSLNNENLTPTWQLAGASSIGKSHLDSELPNQDSFFYQQTPDCSVAVVCDGAGSASLSEHGSRYFAQVVGDFLLQNAGQLANNFSHPSDTTYFITTHLASIRQNLANQIGTEFSLKDYHSTVTAILILPALNQALLLQIGDSPLLTSKFQVTSQFKVENQQLDYFDNLQVFGDDDKTEYINETHFITQDNWADFLRIQWLDTQNVDCIALMTDGCADLVLAGGTLPRQVYRPFFANVVFNLLQATSQGIGNELLQTALDNPATYRLTGDDKTLVVLIKNANNWQTFEPLIEIPTKNDLNQNSLSENIPTSPSVWASNGETTAENSLSNFNTQSVIMTAETVNSAFISQGEIAQNPPPELTAEPITPKRLPEPITPTNSQQTKKLLLAGGGMLLGVLALAGLNRDWIIEKFSAKTPVTSTSATSTPAVTAMAISEPTTTPLPSQLPTPLETSANHEINTPLTLYSLNEPLNVVVGFPDGKIIAPIATPVKVWEHTGNSAENNRAMFAKADCKPLVVSQASATQYTEFSQFHITPNPAWQYANCQVHFDPMSQNAQKQWQKSSLPPEITEIVLPQGISPIFPVPNSGQKATETASATSSVVNGLQVYFLPK